MKQYPEVTILGACPSKSNCYKIIRRGDHGSLCKTDALVEYEQSFFMQNPLRGAGISRRFKFTVDVFFRSDRNDLDNAMKILLDCLQACRTITNDRLCSEIHTRKFIDKANPRVTFTLEELI